MKKILVTDNEAGQRLDKLLMKYLDLAPKGFLYKMLRKKNITLNGKRCEGSEQLRAGDEVELFLADETIEKFSKARRVPAVPRGAGAEQLRISMQKECQRHASCISMQKECRRHAFRIIYEDRHILLIDKPAGMLSQKSKDSDVSLVEHIIAYLLSSGQITEEALRTFRPSVCNRLDRNTSGLIVAGKSLAGLQIMSGIFRDRSVHKYYQCVVKGRLDERRVIRGFLTKDERTNQVTVHSREVPQSSAIVTEYEPLGYGRDSSGGEYTFLQVELITGKTHQIRAHLASVGHPIVGDEKYGDPVLNQRMRERCGIRRQLLHSYRITFPEMPEPLHDLSGRSFIAPLPKEFELLRRRGQPGQG